MSYFLYIVHTGGCRFSKLSLYMFVFKIPKVESTIVSSDPLVKQRQVVNTITNDSFDKFLCLKSISIVPKSHP
jgi:hypothetical protein